MTRQSTRIGDYTFYSGTSKLHDELLHYFKPLLPLKECSPLVEYDDSLFELESSLSHSSALDNVTCILEQTIQLILKCLSVHLYQFVISGDQFEKYLSLCRDMFFIGRADLFQHFFSEYPSLFVNPLTSGSFVEIQQAFVRSLVICELEEDQNISKFHLTLSNSNELEFSYAPPWPIRIILTPALISQYNAVFSLLIRLEYSAKLLTDSWLLLSTLRKAKKQPPTIRQQVQFCTCLRSQFSFILNLIRHQLKVQLIGAGFSDFLISVRTADSFLSVVRSHEKFFNDIFQFPFLGQQPLRRSLDNILMQAIRFHSYVSHGLTDSSEKENDTLNRISRDFFRQIQLTIDLLTASEKKASSFLGRNLSRELVFQILFNNFFTQKY
jgi:hypothetical protein